MKNDYRRLVIALLCNGDNVAEENLGCRNKRRKYRDVDGACDIVGMCNDAAKAISDLLARAEKAESNLDAAQRLLAEKSGVNGTEKVETCFGYTLDKVRELVEADKAGRCVVFPCKNWLDIVFGEQEVFYGIDKDYEENPIREISVDSSSRCTWYNGWESVVLKGYDENGLDWEFSPEDIGKTVFLTREAAEAALAKEGRPYEHQ